MATLLRRMGGGLSFLSVASAGAYLSSCYGRTARAQDGVDGHARPRATVIYEHQVTVGPSQADDVSSWLADFATSALKRPGLLGAKCLRTDAEDKPLVVFVLGGPGAGKGTQCARLVNEYGYEHLSAGDLLRAAQKDGSKDGRLIQECIREGKIVPVEITVRLLKRAMDASSKRRFLVDGFPRNGNNLAGWHQVMGDHARVGGVLMFECSEEVMLKRLLERGKSSGRADDNEESIKKRFRTYKASTLPVVDYYRQLGLVADVDADRPVEEVFESVQDAVRGMHQRHARAAGEGACLLQVYCADRAALEGYAADGAARLCAGLAKQFPDAARTHKARVLVAERSIKPYGLASVRAFD